MIVSFAWTTGAFLAGRKSRTRREWDDAYARRFNVKPNQQELYIDAILQLNFPHEWRYVGDGEVWISRKNPDFINVNGKKLLIEFNGFYTHTKERDEAKAQHYLAYGFRTLNLYYPDIKNENLIVEKIKGFING